MQVLLSRQECGRCGHGVPVYSDTCRRCGHVLHGAKTLRRAGVLYLVLGLALAGAGGYLIVLIAGLMIRSGEPGATTRFTGGAWEAVLAFGALGFVLLLGVTGILMGVWQIRHGRRNPRLVRVVIAFYIIFWAAAVLIRAFL